MTPGPLFIIAISAAAALASMEVGRSASANRTGASVEQSQSRAAQTDSSRADSTGVTGAQSVPRDSISAATSDREPESRDYAYPGQSNIKTVAYTVGAIAMAAVGFLGIRALVASWRRKEEAESMPLVLPPMPQNRRPIIDPFPLQPDHTPQPSPVESNDAGAPGVVRMAKPVEGTLQLLPGRFEIVSGTDRMKEVRFVKMPGPSVVTFGRDAGAGHTHIQVDSPTVSRMHASMRFEAGRWHIKNLSVTNPVVVNGEPLPANGNEQLLNDSDQVEMGDVIFRFRSR